jgi:hypothetical protein
MTSVRRSVGRTCFCCGLAPRYAVTIARKADPADRRTVDLCNLCMTVPHRAWRRAWGVVEDR